MASGVKLSANVRMGYRDMKNNLAMAKRFGAHLETLGRAAQVATDDVGAGSTDMGDVSHVVPSIHPYLGIVDANQALCHQHAFADAASSARGLDTALVAAKALAKTALEVVLDADLRREIETEFSGAR